MSAASIPEFRARRGSRFSNEEAQTIGARLTEMGHLDKPLTPAEIVNDARDPRSPLHRFFQWDDASAAEEYRRTQARQMVGSIRLVLRREKEQTVTRAFHCVVKNEERGYLPALEVFSDEDLAMQVITKARGELRAWLHRYRQYKELAPEAAGVEKLLQDLDHTV